MLHRKHVLVLAISAPWFALIACSTKKPSVFDAGEAPPPAPTPVVTLEPTVEDAGIIDTGVDAGKKLGPYENPTVTKLKRCCATLKAEGTRNAASPEGQSLLTAATTCNTLAAQAGPSGNAPELAPLRAALAGRNVPDACRGL